jgi:hypothetical protein
MLVPMTTSKNHLMIMMPALGSRLGPVINSQLQEGRVVPSEVHGLSFIPQLPSFFRQV